MTSSQSKYDMEYVYGEFGDNYTILIKNDDGSNADISAFDAAAMTIKKPDGTLLVAITTGLTITSPNVIWAMTSAQTTASSYWGEIEVQIQLTISSTKKRLTKILTGFVYENQI